jgi:hypothetical protein
MLRNCQAHPQLTMRLKLVLLESFHLINRLASRSVKQMPLLKLLLKELEASIYYLAL